MNKKLNMDISEKFYDNNAERFSDTRFCLWDVVRDFSKKFKKNDFVCDAGCGNGKNIKYLQYNCNIIGFDKCEKLVNICLNKNFDVSQQDILSLNYDSFAFDYIICIAVIHHLNSKEKHINAIYELLRILKINGELLFTLWAFETDIYSKKKNFKRGDNYINFDKSQRYYYIYDELMLKELLNKFDNKKYIIKYWWERGNWNVIIQKVNH